MVNLKFADTLKNMLSNIFDVSREELEIMKSNTIIVSENNNLKDEIYFRQFMLNLGTDIVRNGTTGLSKTEPSKNPFIRNFINGDISKVAFQNYILDNFYLKTGINKEDHHFSLKTYNNTKEVVEQKLFLLETINERLSKLMIDFSIDYKEECLGNDDIWTAIVIKNLPEGKVSAITDARFKGEIGMLLNNPKTKNNSFFFLVIKEVKENGKVIPTIVNQKTKLDNDLLYKLYNESKTIEELEKNISSTGLPPAELYNTIYTLYSIKRLNEEKYNLIDKVLLKEDELIRSGKLTVLNIPKGFPQKNVPLDQRIQNFLNNRKNNGIAVFLGCSENGKDYVYDSIVNHQSDFITLKTVLNEIDNLQLSLNTSFNLKFDDENKIIPNNLSLELIVKNDINKKETKEEIKDEKIKKSVECILKRNMALTFPINKNEEIFSSFKNLYKDEKNNPLLRTNVYAVKSLMENIKKNEFVICFNDIDDLKSNFRKEKKEIIKDK